VYGEALAVAEDATARAPQNAHWPGHLAEIHIGLAEAAPSAKVAKEEWKIARLILETLDKEGRLPMPRRRLLERARAHK
jgi:hypothetical protein